MFRLWYETSLHSTFLGYLSLLSFLMLPVPFLSCLTRWENIPVKHDYIFLPRTVIRIGSKLSSLPTTLIIFHSLQKSWSIFSFSYYIMPSAASWSSQLGSVLRILPSYLFLPHPAKALDLDRETGQPFHQRIPRTEAMPGMPSPPLDGVPPCTIYGAYQITPSSHPPSK